MNNKVFKPGQKAPNDGEYMEIGETGSGVKNPAHITLEAGQEFPHTKNHNRMWKTVSKKR